MLVRVDALARRVVDQTLHVPVTVAVDLRQCTRATDERIVLRHAAVGVDAHDRAHVAVELLRFLTEEEAVAEAHHQRAIGQQQHAAAGVCIAGLRRMRGEDRLHVGQALTVEACTHDAGVVGVLVAMHEREEQHAAAFEIRRRQHLEQSGLAGVEHRRHALDGRFAQCAVLDHAQAARSLGDERTAVRQEGDGPGMLQTFGHRFDAEFGVRRHRRHQQYAQQERPQPSHHHSLSIAPMRQSIVESITERENIE